MASRVRRLPASLVSLILILAGWALPAVAVNPNPVPGAASGAFVGTVDLSAAILFHPYMMNYDPAQRSFIRDAAAAANPAVPLSQGGDAEFEKKAHQNLEEINRLEDRLQKLRVGYDEEVMQAQTEFEQRTANLPKAKATVLQVQHEQRNIQREQKFSAESRALKAQIDLLQQKNAALAASDPNSRHLSPAEAEQKFRDLLEDVRAVTRQIAAQRGIGIVLDSSQAGIRQIFEQSRPEPLADNSFTNMFNQKMPPGAQRDNPSGQGITLIQRDLALNWYSHRGFLLEPFRNVLGGNFVVTGGYDLTPEVLTALWTRYRVDSSIQALILQALKMSR